MYDNPLLDSNFLTPHDGLGLAAGSQASKHAYANSKGGQTEVNAQAYQTSLVQTQTTLSPVQKRRRSKLDDGSTADVDAPKPKTKRTKITKSNKQVDFDSNDTPEADRAEASLSKPTKKKRKTPTKKQLCIEFVHTNFGQGVYRGMDNEHAVQRLTKRGALIVDKESDDVENVMADRERWVRAIMSAFDKPCSPVPLVKDFGPLVEKFKAWQDENYGHVMKEINEDKVGDIVEAAATVVYSKIVDSHKAGNLELHGLSLNHDYKMTCSQRLTKCIEILEKSAVIRRDVITNTRIVEFVGSPAVMLSRKEHNKFDNHLRSIRDEKQKLLEAASDPKRENEGSAASEVSKSECDGE